MRKGRGFRTSLFICVRDSAVEEYSTPDALIVAPDLVTMLFDNRKFVFKPLIIQATDITGIGILRHEFERYLFSCSANQQGHMAFLYSFVLVDCATHMVIFAFKYSLFISPRFQHNL